MSRPGAGVNRKVVAVAIAFLSLLSPLGARAVCTGDCNGDGEVRIDELVRGVNIALGNAPVAQCPSFDRNGNGQVTIDELVAAVNAALGGCPPDPSLNVRITSPQQFALFGSSPITVNGTISAAATVECNGFTATLSGTTFSARVPIREGNVPITCTATDASNRVATASVQVTLDQTPPRVSVDVPQDGSVVTASPLTVKGVVNDVVVGTVNGEQAAVKVNGIDATVANRSFLVTAVPLTPGTNVLTVTATDRAGNTASTAVRVTLQTAMTDPNIRLVSGNNQTGTIGTELAQPLVVSLADGAGNPLPGRPVIFKVVENDGMLGTGAEAAPSVVVTSDAQGRAQTRWKLGSRSGAGNNRVEATSVGLTGTAIFTASAALGATANIFVDSGSDQAGVAGQPLPRPFVAVVTDSGFNRLANVPVTFSVVKGGGNLGGQTARTVNTDSVGRALVVLTLGSEAGDSNNLVQATFTGNSGNPAAFVASARAAGDAGATRVSGVVLDNTDRPVPGVTLRIDGTDLVTEADEQGVFAFQPAPVGLVTLVVDGGTARRPGTWPDLIYELVTIAGHDNTIGMPIRLLPLDMEHALDVDENRGGTITLPEVPGFSLAVAPGSATFPGGSKRGKVSVTVVHSDKIPMVPGFGQQPRLIVTIQPSGTKFDPPAPITIPNVENLAPRQVAEMYSFDHDLQQFVAIGTGTVSDDGSVLRSDPGVGILKGGWHCGGNPQRTGCCCHCGECQRCTDCQRGTCEPVPNGATCTADGNLCTQDKCVDGQCAHPPENDGEPCDDRTGCSFKQCEQGNCVTRRQEADGASCDDGDACTPTSMCVDGACRGERIDCNDHNKCTDDSCNTAGMCANERIVPPPRSTDINELLSQCPERHQNNRRYEIDGCSVPLTLGAGFEAVGGDTQNPTAGSCGLADTSFGRPQADVAPGDSPLPLPCNFHDICYQTCRSTQEDCDLLMGNKMIEVCDRAYPTLTCPYTGIDAITICSCYLTERVRCYDFASAYFGALRAGGYGAWSARQEQYCDCCN